ncbi:T9SS type A sorting domain-containing protein [Algoriphagus aestuariicola]|uniref:T9SS type A sorting domain-containing protein n=1 Tax=Algoriphagus aestuariicola TaxID=1852016 RepID=A0ABS3BS33_9BACT|nr:YCF48-related protein [Algoriphagus aestuariicola]MBN7802108.1 T9SS type A sorting domain-containing protein [Algoriphagus aestuariicola]
MKKLLPITFWLLMLTSSSLAQTLSRMQSWGLDFESVYWLNAQQGVAVGEKLIALSMDGGNTWEEVLQRFDLRFYDVVLLNAERGVAVGENGRIFITSDSGKTWQEKESGTSNDLFGIAKSSTSGLTAIGQNGEIIRSTDGGESWAKTPSGTNLALNDIQFIGENAGFIAAEGGNILSSQDRGNTWTLSSLPENNALFGIAFSSELIGYVVGADGFFAKTIDGGCSWSALNSGTINTLRKVAISPLDTRIVVAIGDMATITRTANSGSTFTKPSLGAAVTRNLKGMGFKPSSNLLSVVGQDGYLSNSSNAGANWAQKLAGIRNHFTAVDFLNQNTGYVAGENGGLFVTSNGATTLVNRSLPEPITIRSMGFWSTSFGYVGSDNGKIYRTSNSGTSWVAVPTSADRTITRFYLFAPSVVYLSGSRGYISRSFDSGSTWDQTVTSNTLENLKSLIFFDFGYGAAVGDKGQISRTFGGSEWETVPAASGENLNALAKIDSTRAIAVGDGGVILKTEDKAKSWRKIESGTTKKLKSVDFFGTNYGFIAGEDGLALATSDGGETWTPFATGTVRNLESVSAGTDQKAYFAGEDGTLLAYTCVPPSGSLGTIAGDSKSCLTTATYSILESDQTGSDIRWRVDGGEILSGQGTSQIEVKWTGLGRNAVLVSRTNFCGSGETSALEVSVASIPTSDSEISGEGAVCSEGSYTYSLPNIKGVSYTWTVSGGEIKNGQGTHAVEIIWDQAGEQKITVSQENYCGQGASLEKAISVTSAPASPLGIGGEALTSPGEEIYEIETLPGLNYRWSISGNGGRIASGQGSGRILVIWEQEGDFELSVEAQNACGYSSKRILPVNVNIITALEPAVAESLKIYPNPSQGTATVSADNLDSWSGISVVNSLGQAIVDLPIADGQKQIYLSGLPKGLLLIRLQGKQGAVTRKLLVR